MDLILKAIAKDWALLSPIFICSILVVYVAINRIVYYRKNERNISEFIPSLQKALVKNNIAAAQRISVQLGGIISEMVDEALRIYTEQKAGFSRAYDISSSLATRKLERHLTILGTIGGVAPFLGLFGTVVGILYTFQDLATQGNQSAAVATGIASALIATAFGLGVAIIAVVMFNYFQTVVARFESDFKLIKLVFLSFIDSDEEVNVDNNNSIALQ
ncbi:MAG: MotA/TolQ/ExbB proton channel family protein [Candidatus Gastranaerophilales bacterium]|nr:MotA/TolQ/ExbB proton channel family protein [Candidatus Gastranaerophilales bacterium]